MKCGEDVWGACSHRVGASEYVHCFGVKKGVKQK